MVEQRLDAVFRALADPTRRGMLADLALGEKSVGALAEPFAMSFAGASKHVKVLEDAGLVARRKAGRSYLCSLKAEPLGEADRWLRQWERLLDCAARPARSAAQGEARMTAPVILTVTRDFDASPERVFDAWLDPAQARRFLFATPDGEMLTCEIDARPGGRALIVERRPGGDAHHRMRFETIERPHRLVFLFAADPAEDGAWTRVSIEIVATPRGCTLSLIHEMAPEWAAYEEQTRKGWGMILESLGRVLESNDG